MSSPPASPSIPVCSLSHRFPKCRLLAIALDMFSDRTVGSAMAGCVCTNLCSTHWTSPCCNTTRARSSTTPTKGVRPPSAFGGCCRRRGTVASMAPVGDCHHNASATITRRAEQSLSSSRGGVARIVVTQVSISAPRWPSRGAASRLHETQADNRPQSGATPSPGNSAPCPKVSHGYGQSGANRRRGI